MDRHDELMKDLTKNHRTRRTIKLLRLAFKSHIHIHIDIGAYTIRYKHKITHTFTGDCNWKMLYIVQVRDHRRRGETRDLWHRQMSRSVGRAVSVCAPLVAGFSGCAWSVHGAILSRAVSRYQQMPDRPTDRRRRRRRRRRSTPAPTVVFNSARPAGCKNTVICY